MNFGSPNNKLISPSNVNQYTPKSFHNQPNAAVNVQIPLKPGTVSMGFIIECVVLKSYSDLQRLVDTLASKGDLEKKKEIIPFLSRTRNLLIRLQALNKWNPSALKVDKCDKIANLLDEQSSFLIKTAEDLSIMALEKLPLARLHNLLPMIAADILASKTYSRLPNIIKLPVLRSQLISKDDKSRMLLELDRILRIRVSNSRLPYRMRSIEIKNGRVTFTVPDEFKVTCTLMSDHFDHPWHLLDVQFLVKGNNVCRGRSLVHTHQLRALHEIVQIRLNSPQLDSRPSLFHLYDMLHSMALSMQLEVLHEQAKEYMNHQHGVPILDLCYTRASRLSFSYWHRTEKYSYRPKHSITIAVDDEDPRRPLKVKHQPVLSPDNKYSEKMLDTCNISIKNLIAESITTRIYSTLKMVQRLLFPFINGNTLISSINPVLLVPILDIEGNYNNLKIQINSSNGYVKTSFEVTLDKMRGFTEEKITEILMSLDNDINELLMKSFNTVDHTDTKISTNRELITHRRNISISLNKLRVILSKYHCLSVLHQSGFSDLHLLLSRPPLCRERNPERSNVLYSLFAQETRGDCELVFIPINTEWSYYVVVVCETRFRSQPSYKVFGLSTTKVFSASSSVAYAERQWVLRPARLSLLSTEVVARMRPQEEHGIPMDIGGLKRPATTCSDLLSKIRSKSLKLADGAATDTQTGAVSSSEAGADTDSFSITNLPAVVGYMKDNVIFKLLLHEIERRSFVFESERIDPEVFVHSCKVTKFPFPKTCSGRAANLMNKLLAHCTITYFAQPHGCSGGTHVRWEAHFFLASPLVLVDKSVSKEAPITKKAVLCSRRCSEESLSGIREAVEVLVSLWEEMCVFCDCCLLPLLDKDAASPTGVHLTSYEFTQLTFSYGPDPPHSAIVRYSRASGFSVTTSGPRGAADPHRLVRRDLDNYLNVHRSLCVLTRVLQDTADFLSIVLPFSVAPLALLRAGGTEGEPAHLLRTYSLLVLDAYHVVLVFRETFALNIVLSTETNTVQLSDASGNFHACNVSIHEMPLFQEFMNSLEQSFRINIEDEVWSGLFVDQLGHLLGSHSDGRRTPSLLENYLLSCLQLGSRREVTSPLPSGPEGVLLPGNELKIGLIVTDETVPIWSLGLTVASVKADPPWLLEPEMLAMAKAVLDTKIRIPKLPEAALNVFRKLLQLPSLSLQKNMLKILTRPPTVIEGREDRSTVVGNLDLDWGNLQEAISQPQEATSILLRFSLSLKWYRGAKTDQTPEDRSSSLPLVLHYAAKSNQISVLGGTCPQLNRQNLEKEANDMVVGKVNGDTPLLAFVGRLMAGIAEYSSFSGGNK